MLPVGQYIRLTIDRPRYGKDDGLFFDTINNAICIVIDSQVIRSFDTGADASGFSTNQIVGFDAQGNAIEQDISGTGDVMLNPKGASIP